MNPLDWAQNISQWYTDSVKQTIQLLLSYAVPSPQEIQSDFFNLSLGGTFGLSTLIMGGMAVLIGAMIILRPRDDHSRSVTKLVSSMVWLIVFALLFYRGYGLLYGLFQGAGQGALNVMTSSENGTIAQLNDLLLSVNPVGAGVIIILAPFSLIFTIIAMIEAFLFHIGIIGLLIVYPLLIALRSFPVFDVLFHAANAAVIVILVSPLLMTWAFALPVIASNQILASEFTGLKTVLSVAGGLLAAIIPFFIGMFVFSQSRKVFGSVESRVQGAVSITSMPSVDLKDVNRDIDRVRASPIKAIAAEVIGDEILQGGLFSDIKKVAINAAATGFAVAGHPYVSTAIKAAPSVISNVKEKFSTDQKSPGGGDSSV